MCNFSAIVVGDLSQVEAYRYKEDRITNCLPVKLIRWGFPERGVQYFKTLTLYSGEKTWIAKITDIDLRQDCTSFAFVMNGAWYDRDYLGTAFDVFVMRALREQQGMARFDEAEDVAVTVLHCRG